MGKKVIDLHIEGWATLEIDDEVFAVVDDEHRKKFGHNLTFDFDIARHIGWLVLVDKMKLSRIDGWADQPDDNVKIIEEAGPYVVINRITEE